MKRPILLGLVTAIPIPAFLICLVCVLISMAQGSKEFGLMDIVFIAFAALAVTVHLVMFFYYLIRVQNFITVNQNHYLVWLLVLMVPAGQLAFWYFFFWKPSADATAIPA